MQGLVISIPAVLVSILLPSISYPQTKRDIPLPQDKSAAIVTLDYRGGYGLPRQDSRPPLTIFADARVRVVDTAGKASPLETKMSAEELQDLLRFAIDDHKFFEFDRTIANREVLVESKKSGFEFSTFDGVETVIRMRTAEREHEARFYALYDHIRAYPDAKLLANLAAVEERLLHLLKIVKAGGKDRVAEVLKAVNDYLKTAYPTVPAVIEDDFLYSEQPATDRQQFVFLPGRLKPKPTETTEQRIRNMISPAPEFTVEVEYSSGAPPKVQVKNPPQ
jgi:hypothetical protein